jgi:hypothetical protein
MIVKTHTSEPILTIFLVCTKRDGKRKTKSHKGVVVAVVSLAA